MMRRFSARFHRQALKALGGVAVWPAVRGARTLCLFQTTVAKNVGDLQKHIAGRLGGALHPESKLDFRDAKPRSKLMLAEDLGGTFHSPRMKRRQLDAPLPQGRARPRCAPRRAVSILSVSTGYCPRVKPGADWER
jgi:hypothetical protein